jgi:hypothetical protein
VQVTNVARPKPAASTNVGKLWIGKTKFEFKSFFKTLMKSKLAGFIFLLLLGLTCLAGSIIALIMDIYLDLAKTDTVTGRVLRAGVIDIKIFRIKRNRYKSCFYFQLHNSREKFAVLRSDEAYSDLQLNIRPGDTIKVYYRSVSNEYNQHVFQVEKNGRILEHYYDYNERVSTRAAIGLLAGLVILAFAFMRYYNLNLLTLMNKLVDGKNPN